MSKKHNKFMVGAVTAAMVATAVAPAAGAEVNTKADSYSDVSVENDHFDNIYEAQKLELMRGYTDGTFKPGLYLTRSNVVKALARYVAAKEGKTVETYDVSGVTPFSDVPATIVDKELYNASLIVKKAKIFSGDSNKLNPLNDISRQQMAKVLVNTFGLKDLANTESKVTDNNEAFAEFVPYINILSENGVTIPTKFSPKKEVTRAQFASFLVRAYKVSEEATVAPTVASVSALNATHIAVTFSTAVAANSAVNLDNYVFTKNDEKFGEGYAAISTAIEQARVLADGKTVVFELKNALNQGDKYGVDVKNAVKGTNGVNVEAYGDTQREFKDQAAPVIQDTQYSAGTVTLYYNEPVSFNDADFGIHVDGIEIAPEDIQYNTVYNTAADGKVTDIQYKVTVDVSASKDLNVEGDHKVVIYNLRDEVKSTSQAGNKVQLASTTYKVVKQEPVNVALKVDDVVGYDFNSLAVHFNKTAKNAKVTVYHGNTKFYEKTVSDSQHIHVDLPYTVMSAQYGITPLYATDATSTGVRVVVEEIEDANKVIGDTYEKEITLNRDSAKPTAAKSEVTVAYEVDEKTGLLTDASIPTITIPLNRTAYKAKDVDLLKQVTVTDVNGVQRTLQNVTLNSTNNALVIELAKDSGTKQKFEDLLDFKVSVKANSLVVDTDRINVESEKTPTTKWTVGENTNTLNNNVINITAVKKSVPGQPVDSNFKYVEGVQSVNESTDNVITVNYKNSMTASAALLENYSLDGKAFPQGTTVSMDATSKVVTITLPEGSIAKTQDVRLLISKEVRTQNNEIIVGSITDKEMFMTKDALTLYDNVAPLLTSAAFVEGDTTAETTAKTTDQLEFTFSEALDATTLTNLGDSLVVKANGTKAVAIESSVAGKANDDGEFNTVVITLVEPITTTQKATITVDKDEVQVIKDIRGNLLSTGTIVEVVANDVKKLAN